MSQAVLLMGSILRVLAPVAQAMLAEALKGGNPLDVLVKERVRDIVPSPLLSELELAAVEMAELNVPNGG